MTYWMENIKNGMKKKVKKYDKLNSLVADVLKDFKRIIYRAKQLNYAWNKDPLIFKAYEGPLDWKSKLAVLKKIQPSSSVGNSTEKEDDITIEMDKREKRALRDQNWENLKLSL